MKRKVAYGVRAWLSPIVVALGVLFVAAALNDACAESKATQISYEGTLGPTRIGLTLIVDPAGTITGGHYFYAKYLKDIPITGSVANGSLALKGSDGGSFALKFRGNGSESGKPLDFNNSVGLDGKWSMSGKSLPVALTAGGQATVSGSGRWYEMVTDESDAAFEARVQGFYKAVLAGDRKTAAKYVAFPLRLNQAGKGRIIHSAEELSAQWEHIFTPAYLTALKKDMPHDLGISNGQAMLGPGDIWFGPKGATALNLP